MARKLTTLKIWRVDVPPQAFVSSVDYGYLQGMDPINMNILRVKADSAEEARAKAYEFIRQARVPVSSEDLKVGEYPSKIECFVK